jgi:hypothetical protein
MLPNITDDTITGMLLFTQASQSYTTYAQRLIEEASTTIFRRLLVRLFHKRSHDF